MVAPMWTWLRRAAWIARLLDRLTAPDVCPRCGKRQLRVIYFGLPMRICVDPECACLVGIWSWAPVYLRVFSEDETGAPCWAFTVYRGSYWRALWRWVWNTP